MRVKFDYLVWAHPHGNEHMGQIVEGHPQFHEARKRANNIMTYAEITDLLVIDARAQIVEVMKGLELVFENRLHALFPGWKKGIVIEPGLVAGPQSV